LIELVRRTLPGLKLISWITQWMAAFRPLRTTIYAGGTQTFLRSASPITRLAIGAEAHQRRARALEK
jgi:hypothetical protein